MRMEEEVEKEGEKEGKEGGGRAAGESLPSTPHGGEGKGGGRG
jgi:hypothetical protein